MNGANQILKQIKPLLIVVTYAIVLYLVLSNISALSGIINLIINLIKPVLIGFVIAYVLNILMTKIEKQLDKCGKYKRPVALLLTLIFAIIVIVLLVIIIVPQLIESAISIINGLGQNMINFINDIIKLLDSLNIDNEIILEKLNEVKQLPWDKIVTNALSWLEGLTGSLETIANTVINSTMTAISKFAIGFSGFMISLYFLSSKEKFVIQAKKVIYAFFKKSTADKLMNVGKKANYIYSSFIGGQLVEACILGGLFFIGLTILKMPYALLISVIIAVTALIPIFGAMIGMCIGFILILPINMMQAIWFVVFFQVLQQIENNLIYPRVVGSSVGLPGVYVLISILLFGNLFGLFGMLVAVPTGAFIYQLGSDLINGILEEKKITIE